VCLQLNCKKTNCDGDDVKSLARNGMSSVFNQYLSRIVLFCNSIAMFQYGCIFPCRLRLVGVLAMMREVKPHVCRHTGPRQSLP
jgi:hypothetical protein